MQKAIVGSVGWLATLAICASARAQTSSTIETGSDGIQYRVTRSIETRSVPHTEYQTREQKVYRPQANVQYQTYQQNYVTPVTEYQWVSRLRGWWNPFDGPYWSYELRPVTRWQTTPGTVQVPVTRTEWVEETRTAQVPVTTYRTAQAERVTREPLGIAPGGQTSVANRYGGQQMTGDPPRSPSDPYRR